MKTRIILSALLVMALFHAQEKKTSSASASEMDYSTVKLPQASPREVIQQHFSISHIKLDYSRPNIGPSKRKIFGALVPFDQLWRTGANQASTITFGQDVKIEGKLLPKGEYALYSVPKSSGAWTIIFSEDLQLFQKDTKNGIPQEAIKLKIEVPMVYQEKTIETFTIRLSEIQETTATVWLAWENASLSFKVEVADVNVVMNVIEMRMKTADQKFAFEAADYYTRFYANKELTPEDLAKIEKLLLWFKDIKQDEHWYWYLIKTQLFVLLKNKEAAELSLADTEKRITDMKASSFAAPALTTLKASVDALPKGKAGKKTKPAATADKKK